MKPIESYETEGRTLQRELCPKAGPEDNLDSLVTLAVDQEHPIIIEDGGTPVGIVTKDSLLHAIKGEG